jgi:hypothetical protein
MIKTKNCETIAVKLATGTKYPFSEVQNISGRKILGVEAHLLSNVSLSPNGEALCNATAQKYAYLTLSSGGKEIIKDMPVNSLVATNRNGLIFEMEGSIITLPKSYIQFSKATDIVSGEVVLLTFYYE